MSKIDPKYLVDADKAEMFVNFEKFVPSRAFDDGTTLKSNRKPKSKNRTKKEIDPWH